MVHATLLTSSRQKAGAAWLEVRQLAYLLVSDVRVSFVCIHKKRAVTGFYELVVSGSSSMRIFLLILLRRKNVAYKNT